MSLFGGVIPVTGITFLIFSVFAIAAIGYALGRITVKGVSLGTAAIVKGENVPEPGVPESFKVLIKELQSLGLDIKVLSDTKEEIKIGEMVDDDDGAPLDVNIAGTEDDPGMMPGGAEFTEFDDFDFGDDDDLGDDDDDDGKDDLDADFGAGFSVLDAEDEQV